MAGNGDTRCCLLSVSDPGNARQTGALVTFSGMRMLAAAVLALALAACGSETQQPQTPAPSVDSNHEMGLKYAQCMREHGVNVPDPEPGKAPMVRITGGNTTQSTVEAAQKACQQFRPGGGTGQQADPKRLEAIQKFAQCMRDNGVPDFPDPDNGMIRMTGKVTEDPDFPAAQQKCAKEYLPEAAQR